VQGSSGRGPRRPRRLDKHLPQSGRRRQRCRRHQTTANRGIFSRSIPVSVGVCVCGLKNYKLARFDGRDVCSFFFLFLETSFVDFRRRGCATGEFRHATGAGFRDEGRKVNRMNKKEIEVIHGTKEVNCCVILLLSFFIMSETFFIHFILNPPYLCRGNFRCKESEKCAGGQIKSVDFLLLHIILLSGRWRRSCSRRSCSKRIE
jgi:hypothetical protein